MWFPWLKKPTQRPLEPVKAVDSLDLEQRIKEYVYRGTVDRFFYFSIVLSFCAIALGPSTFPIIQRFDPSVTFWDNLWPRFFVTMIPFLGIAYFLKKSRFSSRSKVYWGILFLCITFDAGAMIHVWPIALRGQPEIILYFDSTNNTFFAATGMMAALSFRGSILATGIMVLTVLVPLTVVVYKGGDLLILRSIAGNSIFNMVAAMSVGIGVHKVNRRLAAYEIEKQNEASKFLGKAVAQAIFEDKAELLEKTSVSGFIVSLDIRDSTELQKTYGEEWRLFRKEYFAIVGRAVGRHFGHIQKTAGDSHVITFGVMDQMADLSDIPGLSEQDAEAQRNRLTSIARHVYACMDEIFAQFQVLSQKRFGGVAIRLGGGVDQGWVERAIQGDESAMLELDIAGDAVNCSNRLQEYTKVIQQEFSQGSSLLVISPTAAAFVSAENEWTRIQTSQRPIRNFPSIGAVMVKQYFGPESLAIAA